MPRGRASIAMLKTRQPYQDDIQRISQDLTGCEPEVCLAVRVPHLSSSSVDEDDSVIDAFLSSHGFEYVDATQEQSSRGSAEIHEEEFAGLVVFLHGEQSETLLRILRYSPHSPSIRRPQYNNVAFNGDGKKERWQ
jgi:hypothetical protein